MQLLVALGCEFGECVLEPGFALREGFDDLFLFLHEDLVSVLGAGLYFPEFGHALFVEEICTPGQDFIKVTPQFFDYLNLSFECHFHLIRNINLLHLGSHDLRHQVLELFFCVEFLFEHFENF